MIEEPIVRTEPQSERENPIPSQSEESSAHHYSRLDLGFRCNVAGPVSIRSGTFRVRQLRQRLEEIWEFLKWLIPLAVFVSFSVFGGYLNVDLLVLWRVAIFFALLWLLWRPLVYILKGADAVLRHPRCKGCRLTMTLTSSWARSVTSNAEVVLGYQDCIAALQERMWEDAAKLLSIHGAEPTTFRTNELVSTPLRYHLQFYECGICSHHGARLTTDDLLEDDWRPRVQFTEAYCGALAKTPPLLARLRSVPSRMADTIVGSFRHSDPIRINTRLIGLIVSIVSLSLIVAATLIQGRRAEKARERHDALSPRLSTADVPVAQSFTLSLGTSQWQARYGLTLAQYQVTYNELVSEGYRPRCLSVYLSGGSERYAVLWVKDSGPAWQAQYDLPASEYQQDFVNLVRKGYRLTWLSGYESGGIVKYAAIWEKRRDPPWEARVGLTADQLQRAVTLFTQRGYRPIRISGYELGGITKYAVIWEKSPGPPWKAYWGLSRSQTGPIWDQLTHQGYRVVDSSVYGTAASVQVAEIFQGSNGGGWYSFGWMTAHGLQSRLDDLGRQGFHPTELIAYNVGDNDLYSALWEK
jgi:hypothetical protein